MWSANIPVLVLLLLLSAFFSGTESAFFSLNRVQLRRLEREDSRSSRQILKTLERPSEFLTSMLIGNTLVNVAISVLATSLFLAVNRDHGVEIAIAVTTAAVLLVGEVTPKTIAVNFPERVCRTGITVVRLILVLLGPLVAAVSFLSNAVLRLLGLERNLRSPSRQISRGEIGTLLEGADKDGIMSARESQLVQNILDFSTTRAEEVMTPRVDMIAAPIDMERPELETLAMESKHSRIPVYRHTIDEIIGYLPTRELLLHPETRHRELVRSVQIFPDRAPISQIFNEAQKDRTPMNVIVNEYGETVGLITQEDLLEELVGEIYDEFEPREDRLRRIGEGIYLAIGQLNPEEFNEALGTDLPTEDAVTLNGFLTGVHGGIPAKGAVIQWESIRFEITKASRHRILECRVDLRDHRGNGGGNGTDRDLQFPAEEVESEEGGEPEFDPGSPGRGAESRFRGLPRKGLP